VAVLGVQTLAYEEKELMQEKDGGTNEPDNTYWQNIRLDLSILVERLSPDDALAIVRKLVERETDDQMGPVLAGMIRGYVARRDDEQERGRAGIHRPVPSDRRD
jgi:hypothetical protein